jgi:hypothetical protein
VTQPKSPALAGLSGSTGQIERSNIVPRAAPALRFGASAGRAAARRRAGPSSAAARRTSGSAVPRGRDSAGNCASPDRARGCGWSDGIVDNSGRTSLSRSSRAALALLVAWTRQIYPCGPDPKPASNVHAAAVRAPVGRDDVRPYLVELPSESDGIRAWRRRRLRSQRSRVATDGLGSSVSGSTHPELPLSFGESRIQLPRTTTPLCAAVNTLASAATRGERRFAESCGAVIGSFMELSEFADKCA